MNAGARLIFDANRREHVTPLLRQLHWLRVPERITFKLATMVFQCVNGSGLGYLSADVRRVADVPDRKHLRSAASSSLAIPAVHLPDVLQLVIAPSSSQPLLSGTSFPRNQICHITTCFQTPTENLPFRLRLTIVKWLKFFP